MRVERRKRLAASCPAAVLACPVATGRYRLPRPYAFAQRHDFRHDAGATRAAVCLPAYAFFLRVAARVQVEREKREW